MEIRCYHRRRVIWLGAYCIRHGSVATKRTIVATGVCNTPLRRQELIICHAEEPW